MPVRDSFLPADGIERLPWVEINPVFDYGHGRFWRLFCTPSTNRCLCSLEVDAHAPALDSQTLFHCIESFVMLLSNLHSALGGVNPILYYLQGCIRI